MPHSNLPRPCLMLVTEPMERSKLLAVVRESVDGGVNVVQLRDKTLTRHDLMDTAVMLKACLYDRLLLVNGCPFAAVEAHAGGVHLPEKGLQVNRARAIVGAHRLIGRSVHSVDTAVRAACEGADYLTVGTIFASHSHPDIQPAGAGFIHSVCSAVDLPVIAIGGVTPENVGRCLAAGASGVAVLSAILHAADPRGAAMRYWDRLTALSGE